MTIEKRKSLYLPLLTIVLVLATIAFISGRIRARSTLMSKPTTNSVPASKKTREGYEVITLTRRGFEPEIVTRAKGAFFLSVENRSRVNHLVLQLNALHGNRVREVAQPDDQLDWVEELDLNPGDYVLTEANHPDRTCRLTITAQ